MPYLVSVAHLLALSIGLAAVYARWRSLRRVRTASDLPPVFLADNWYGVAALVWLSTGLWRAFGGLEKGTEHYLASHWFIAKLGVFGLVFALELFPMVMLIRWRRRIGKGLALDLAKSPLMAALTLLELPLLVVIVFLAAAMARGM